MAYISDLGNGQSLYINNQGTQTVLTLSSSKAGQQQSQSCSVTTGSWLVPPTLFRLPSGLVLRLEASQGQIFVAVQAGQLQVMTTPPSLTQAEVLPLQRTEATTANPMSPMEPMQPMQPMQPMKMGNMEMQMNPMQMRMGNMELRMEEGSPSLSKRFCPQCGQAVTEGDRFCSQCGQALSGQALR